MIWHSRTFNRNYRGKSGYPVFATVKQKEKTRTISPVRFSLFILSQSRTKQSNLHVPRGNARVHITNPDLPDYPIPILPYRHILGKIQRIPYVRCIPLFRTTPYNLPAVRNLRSIKGAILFHTYPKYGIAL